MCTSPIPQHCPHEGCTGQVTYANEACSTCEGEILWLKDPNRPGGYKPIIRPSGG